MLASREHEYFALRIPYFVAGFVTDISRAHDIIVEILSDILPLGIRIICGKGETQGQPDRIETNQ